MGRRQRPCPDPRAALRQLRVRGRARLWRQDLQGHRTFGAAEEFRAHPGFRDSVVGRRDRRCQAAGRRQEQPAGCLCPPGGLARLGDDGRVGTDQHHPSRRRDPRTIPAMAKAAGLYMICTISKHKAEREGYADAMMLDWEDRVAECTGANIFFIKDGKIHTPIADCFLAGITRATAIDLAKRRGIEVIERRIMPDELAGFSECFITGTAAEITPVSEIARWKFTPGAISEQLMADYTAEVQPKGKAAAA